MSIVTCFRALVVPLGIGLFVVAACGEQEPSVEPSAAEPVAVSTPTSAPPQAPAPPLAVATIPRPRPTAAPPAIPTATAEPAAPTPVPTPDPSSALTMSASDLSPTPGVGTATPVAAPANPTPQTLVSADVPEPPAVQGLVPGGQIAAPAPIGLDGWINSPPLDVPDLVGNVILIDFWTYTCINCVRTLPYLQDWHEKYADHGLLILGVHRPEFEFEKIYENVAAATANLGVTYPVAQDNASQTWFSYRVQAWPTKYIIDSQGYVRYYHRGEGAYADTELVIRYLLEEVGADLSGIKLNSDPDPQYVGGGRSSDPETFITRELYGGSLRSIDQGGAYILNEDYYEETDTTRLYTDPGDWKNHFLVLSGLWTSGPESLTHARNRADPEDYLGLKFFANEVNAVVDVESGEGYEFIVTMEGSPIPSEAAGADISFDAAGNSVVKVDTARMYRLVRQTDVSAHELKLFPQDDRFSLFAFTFGAYAKDAAE